MTADSEVPHHASETTDRLTLAGLSIRGAIGGVFMGLANLVPGISGGTMLLATGVYPAFIAAIADLTTLRFRVRSVTLLAAIATTAALSILLFAGLMRDLVVEVRWVMYSLFIGLTLGGVPLVWRLARPAVPSLYVAAAVAFAGMAVMALGADPNRAGEANSILLFFSGLAGASAMILPGVSGGYLLLLLGQYEPILGAIDQVKRGLLGENGSGMQLDLVFDAMWVVVPVGLGVVVGIVGVSNLLKWLLDRFEKPTLGALLGLLLGAIVGLWPYQQPIPPTAGDIIDGRSIAAEEAAELDVKHWRVEYFDPSAGHVAGTVGLILLGLGSTLLIDRVGSGGRNSDAR